MTDLGPIIAAKLAEQRDRLKAQWESSLPVHHVFLDGVLPSTVADRLAPEFPPAEDLTLRDTIRERKRVGVALSKYQPLVGEVLLAFQHPSVLKEVEHITGIQGLLPDPSFYASGISLMEKGDFLNPHLDNSHDGDGRLYRVLNALYYASPGWRLENGGNLELWEKGLRNGHTIVSAFNRLVLMETNRASWHSVSPVVVDGSRRCFSNYYFTAAPPESRPYSHVTTFAGRPDEKVKGMVLRVDGVLRNAAKRMFPSLGTKTSHRLSSDETSKER